MIDFSLNILQEFAETIPNYQTTSNKDRDIRAFIIFYDSIVEVELKAEKILNCLEKYTDLFDVNFDLSILRALIWEYSFAIYKLVDNFRKYGFSRFGIPLEVFEPELAETFVTIGSIKSIFCRSLLEVAVPHTCTDRMLPAIEQRYSLRILDYKRWKYSTKEVQRIWKIVLAHLGTRDILQRQGSFPLITLKSFTEKERWMNSVSLYNYYRHEEFPRMRHPEEVLLNETYICWISGFKIVSFTDIADLRNHLQRSRASLENLCDRREKLKEFLSSNFSMSDFF
jgi:hypothetical protein